MTKMQALVGGQDGGEGDCGAGQADQYRGEISHAPDAARLSRQLLLLAAPSRPSRSSSFRRPTRSSACIAEDRNFRQETANWEFVIANVNRLHPAFLVVTRRPDQQDWRRRADRRIQADQREAEPGHPSVQRAGQSRRGERTDARNAGRLPQELRPGLLFLSRRAVYGIVLDSSLLKAPAKVAEEARAAGEVAGGGTRSAAAQAGATPVIFQHIRCFSRSG